MAEDQKLESLLSNLQEQIEATQAKLASLQKAYDALAPDGSLRTKYRGIRTWVAIREYLREVGSASLHDIVDALLAGGADLGKYPLRTVKISVSSPHMKKLFKAETVGNDEVVTLLERKDGLRMKARLTK
ncbi:MAG TPA: hypothetical protein VFA02_03920 [Pseudacidobacterium sp.]|nr:hypothetical protein [Pseudacidobacterium sp.]